MNRATQMLRATGPPGKGSFPKPGDDGQLRQETKPSPP